MEEFKTFTAELRDFFNAGSLTGGWVGAAAAGCCQPEVQLVSVHGRCPAANGPLMDPMHVPTCWTVCACQERLGCALPWAAFLPQLCTHSVQHMLSFHTFTLCADMLDGLRPAMHKSSADLHAFHMYQSLPCLCVTCRHAARAAPRHGRRLRPAAGPLCCRQGAPGRCWRGRRPGELRMQRCVCSLLDAELEGHHR